MENSRWQCPQCGSKAVQISLPTWYTETTDFKLTFVSTDEEADVMWWFCTECEESDTGEPREVIRQTTSE